MGKGLRQIKAGNSKSDLVKAIMMYQKALFHYANDEHWVATYEKKFVWNGEGDPRKVAKMVLGIQDKKPAVREPDKDPGPGHFAPGDEPN